MIPARHCGIPGVTQVCGAVREAALDHQERREVLFRPARVRRVLSSEASLEQFSIRRSTALADHVVPSDTRRGCADVSRSLHVLTVLV